MQISVWQRTEVEVSVSREYQHVKSRGIAWSPGGQIPTGGIFEVFKALSMQIMIG